MDRYRLLNSYTCASIDNELLNDTVNYIYNTYDVDYIKEIIFMGDCATWIKTFLNLIGLILDQKHLLNLLWMVIIFHKH